MRQLKRQRLKLIERDDVTMERRAAIEEVGALISQGMECKAIAEVLGRPMTEPFLLDWAAAQAILLTPFKITDAAMDELCNAVRAKVMLANVHGTLDQQKLALQAAGQQHRVKIDLRHKMVAPQAAIPELHAKLMDNIQYYEEKNDGQSEASDAETGTGQE